VEKIRKSLRTVEAAFEEILPMAQPGVREIELSAELEYRMKRHGAAKVSFDLIVASGSRSALPHGIASEKRIRRNEFLVFDLGAILRGYSSDFTRTVFIGRPPARARKIYQIVRESQESAIAGLRAGVLASHIDQLARSKIQQLGYGRHFVHSTGHGIGVEVHESPFLSARSRAVLKAGHVVTIEPGIYIPEYGGVRIEDIVLVTEKGYRNLTQSSHELITL
jgi:Xaa-Pro aminopeptidase